MSIIQTDDLSFEYIHFDDQNNERKYQTALKKINIDIAEGEFVTVLGHNGCGKSTLAKHINALLLPTDGTIWIDGLSTKDEKNLWKIRQTAGMVFQNPDNQLIATIVEEDVAFGPENLGIPSEEIRTRVDAALLAVEMEKYKNNSTYHLSGGQKQRVAIAGILAMKPRLIVLDEPTAMLDPSGRSEVIDTIIRLNKEENITVLLITHFMNEAVMADRVFVMNEGQIEMSGTPKEIFSKVERMKKLGLDVPDVTEICFELKNLGVDIQTDIMTIDEMVDEICRLKQEI